jgi:hypothetical protein
MYEKFVIPIMRLLWGMSTTFATFMFCWRFIVVDVGVVLREDINWWHSR